ncbi:hypothetical protein FACS1894162_6310 [Bacteroidia bacterium]|nr:hypothetical protein FACS1894162_6310 [Bacteroidia bacterium]
MVAKSFVKLQKDVTKTLIIQPQFYEQMAEILEYGIEQFGAKVAYDFYKTAINKVLALSAMPDSHPQSRFIESTNKKVYRNILVKKYAILYSVTARTIRVITIYHQSINPARIKGFAK